MSIIRRHFRLLSLLVVTFLYLNTATATAINANITNMLKRVTPSVVNIAVQHDTPFPQLPAGHPAMKTGSLGSGVIIDAKRGLIITNAHVVKDAKIMVVTLKDTRRYHAKLIAADTDYDLAVIQIKATHLKAIEFFNSDHAMVGSFVAAIGSPFGLTQTVTSGMISAIHRNERTLRGLQSFLQTDAPINPGNSGGALVNTAGQLVGINTAIFSVSGGNNGIGFAIPSNIAFDVARQLVQYGEVKRGMLGILAQDLNPNLADAMQLNTEKGVLVAQVMANGAALHSPIKAGDVITSVNDRPVSSAAQLRDIVSLIEPGKKVSIHYLHKHQKQVTKIKLGDPNKKKDTSQTPLLAGTNLRKFDQVDATGKHIQGLLVVAVDPNSQAALGGLRQGDVILRINGHKIRSLTNLLHLKRNGNKNLLLKLHRDQGPFFVVVDPSS